MYDEKGKILSLERESKPHLWHSGPVCCITPCRFPDVTGIPTPTGLCSSLPQRSVQTTKFIPPEL